MGQPYVGEIRMFAGNFAPVGWHLCDGTIMAISENDTLFNLIGTTYGGDGQDTFGLPDLRGRAPMHMGTWQGTSFQIGELSGTEQVTLITAQMPIHTHAMIASTSPATGNSPVNSVLAESPSLALYRQIIASINMNPAAVTLSGGSQPHENMQPYLCVNFIISMFGVFPSQG